MARRMRGSRVGGGGWREDEDERRRQKERRPGRANWTAVSRACKWTLRLYSALSSFLRVTLDYKSPVAKAHCRDSSSGQPSVPLAGQYRHYALSLHARNPTARVDRRPRPVVATYIRTRTPSDSSARVGKSQSARLSRSPSHTASLPLTPACMRALTGGKAVAQLLPAPPRLLVRRAIRRRHQRSSHDRHEERIRDQPVRIGRTALLHFAIPSLSFNLSQLPSRLHLASKLHAKQMIITSRSSLPLPPGLLGNGSTSHIGLNGLPK